MNIIASNALPKHARFMPATASHRPRLMRGPGLGLGLAPWRTSPTPRAVHVDIGGAAGARCAAPATNLDRGLLSLMTSLLVYGVVMVYSASTGNDDGGLASLQPLLRHVATVAIGLVCGGVAWLMPCALWRRITMPLLLGSLLLLTVVLIPGLGIVLNGSRRWFYVGFFYVQPSELAKLFIVLFTAGFIANHRHGLDTFVRGVLPIAIILALSASLLLAEPDLGATLVIITTVLAMLLLGGLRFSHFSLALLVMISSLALLIVIEPYRLARIFAFVDPWKYQFDSGFQLVQALIAFGRGEWFGVGLGAGIQKLHYLPHASSDFLLAVIGEELGLFGTLTVIVLFSMFLCRGFYLATRARRHGLFFESFVLQGLCLLIVLQALVNIGVNLGVLPTKGLTLPFMSRGGSSLVTCCVAVGIMLSAERSVRCAWRRRA